MKALVLETLDAAPVLRERTLPPLASGQVRVRLNAAALNRRDVWIRRGKYPGIHYPIILGSDGCGEVVEAHSDANDWVGQRVVMYPAFDWGDDERYQSSEFRILGLPDDGTFAEFIDSDVVNLALAPAHLSDAAAAALPLAGLTAWRALVTRGRVRAGDRVLISGVGGGVALMALQFAAAHGAHVYATSSDVKKLERARSLGASGGVLYSDENWETDLKALSPGGFDIVIDGAGGSGFGTLSQVLAPGGRLVFYGGTRGKWPAILPQRLFYRQVELLASTMGSPAEFKAMLAFVNEHRMTPVVDSVFALEDGAEAFDYLEANRQFGKVVLQIRSEASG